MQVKDTQLHRREENRLMCVGKNKFKLMDSQSNKLNPHGKEKKIFEGWREGIDSGEIEPG